MALVLIKRHHKLFRVYLGCSTEAMQNLECTNALEELIYII